MEKWDRFNRFLNEYRTLVEKYSGYIDSFGKYGSPCVILSETFLSKTQIDEIMEQLAKEGMNK